VSALASRASQHSAIQPPRPPAPAARSLLSRFTLAESKTILIIEDEPSVADALRLILEDEGHRVLTAGTGRGGLELARAERPRLVITDLLLPDASGLELLAALGGEQPHLPVILITSHGTPEIFAQARQAGAVAVLPKPFAPADLLSLIKQVDGRQ